MIHHAVPRRPCRRTPPVEPDRGHRGGAGQPDRFGNDSPPRRVSKSLGCRRWARHFVGTILTGGVLAAAAVLADIDLGLNAVAGAITVGADQRALPEPVIYDVVSRLVNQSR